MRQSKLFIIVGLRLGLAMAADIPNPVVKVTSCQDITCSPPNNSICSTANSAGPPVGVGIAANAVNIASTSLSFTLINGLDENGFTGMGSSQYEHSDQQLFVGLDPTLGEDIYPSGCVLMMQYLAQTFPLESFGDTDGTRADIYKNTTSCDGVIDTFCQSSISNMIRSFNATESNNSSSSDKCMLLTSHVNGKLQENHSTCGGEGTWIANFMNVTGGALPGPSSIVNQDSRLGGGNCHAVLPANYQLHRVAVMTQLYFSDHPSSESEYYEKIFGGQRGYTPVIAIFFSGAQSSEFTDSRVQFSCLQTYQPNGDAPDNLFESTAGAFLRKMDHAPLLMALLCVCFLLLM